jgi:hypothetical protein
MLQNDTASGGEADKGIGTEEGKLWLIEQMLISYDLNNS